MLQSTTIQKRQSEVRERLAVLSGTAELTDEQRNELRSLDGEYQDNELKYRAALIAEDQEREKAGKELETRAGAEWDKLVGGYELRQVALHYDEGRALDGKTAEVVQELRSKGGYRGVPVPFAKFETRANETVASNLPDPVRIAPIMDRLFPASVAAQMGTRFINIAAGSENFPVVTDGAVVGWATSETGSVGTTQAFKASGNSLAPDHTMGVQMKITRKSLKQTAGIEEAIRRDMGNAIQTELDKVIFLGAGASGQPHGVIAKANATYGINENGNTVMASWSAFKAEIVEFLKNNTAAGPGEVSILLRPEVWAFMDDEVFDPGSGVTEWDRLVARVGRVVQSAHALASPAMDLSKALLTVGQPIYCGLWGAVDVIRDPYSDAASGGLRLTGLVTTDVTVTRAEQLRVCTQVETVGNS